MADPLYTVYIDDQEMYVDVTLVVIVDGVLVIKCDDGSQAFHRVFNSAYTELQTGSLK